MDNLVEGSFKRSAEYSDVSNLSMEVGVAI